MKKREIKINLEQFKRRYWHSKRKNKTKLLNELCDIYGYNRKYLLQLFNYLTNKRYVHRGPKRRYEGEELLEPLKRIWLAADQMCGKRLKTALVLWLPAYEESYEILPEKIKQKLLAMSPATLDRVLKPYRARYDAEIARRRYLKVDPDNRLVADTLEADWNEKLRVLNQLQQEHEQ